MILPRHSLAQWMMFIFGWKVEIYKPIRAFWQICVYLSFLRANLNALWPAITVHCPLSQKARNVSLVLPRSFPKQLMLGHLRTGQLLYASSSLPGHVVASTVVGGILFHQRPRGTWSWHGTSSMSCGIVMFMQSASVRKVTLILYIATAKVSCKRQEKHYLNMRNAILKAVIIIIAAMRSRSRCCFTENKTKISVMYLPKDPLYCHHSQSNPWICPDSIANIGRYWNATYSRRKYVLWW